MNDIDEIVVYVFFSIPISWLFGDKWVCKLLLDGHQYADETERYGVEPVCTFCGKERVKS